MRMGCMKVWESVWVSVETRDVNGVCESVWVSVETRDENGMCVCQ
jgi:hypothetical protein